MNSRDRETTCQPPLPSRPKVRSWRTVKRAVAFSLIILGVLLALGYWYEQAELRRISTELNPPGERVDVGGRALHVQIQGHGIPTVLLDAGAAGSSLDWTLVAPELAKTTRVVSFDRAGLGWSDPSPKWPTAGNVVSDLRRALRVAGIEPPYVLVGHSLGGLHMRLFYYTHPGEVVGMVLVDPAHENEQEWVPADVAAKAEEAETILGLASTLARFGITRLAMKAHGAGGMPEHPELLSKSTQAALIDLGARRSQLRAALKEFQTVEETGAQITTASFPMGDLPVTVISAGQPSFGLGHSMVAAMQEKCRELADSSPGGRLRIVDDSAHYIHIERPDVVVEEVLRVVAKVRETQSQPRFSQSRVRSPVSQGFTDR